MNNLKSKATHSHKTMKNIDTDLALILLFGILALAIACGTTIYSKKLQKEYEIKKIEIQSKAALKP